MTHSLLPAPDQPASRETLDSDLVELVEQLGDFPATVAFTIVEPHRWWDDEQCGYCPEPVDELGPAPRRAVAYVCYRGYRHSTDVRVYRDTVCPGDLHVAVMGKVRAYRQVWVEIPAPACRCNPTYGQSCPVCDGTLIDEVTAEISGEVTA